MTRKRSNPLLIILLACPGLSVASPEFAWQFPVLHETDSGILRIALSPEVSAHLHLADGTDWEIVDTNGRSTPAVRLSAQHLAEHRVQQRELAFDQRLLETPIEQRDSPLTLDLEHGSARLLIRSPQRLPRPEDPPMVFQALLAGPLEPANDSEYWLRLDFEAGQALDLDCRLHEATDEGPADKRVTLTQRGDTRPRQYQSRTRLLRAVDGWHLSCFADEPPTELRLVGATLEQHQRFDHRRREAARPSALTMDEDGLTTSFTLAGPVMVEALRLSATEARVISQIRLQSRSDPNQAWQDRGRLTLDTVTRNQTAAWIFADGIRDAYWRLLADPPLADPPTVELEAVVDEIAFVAQGQPPWALLIGSRSPGTTRLGETLLTDLIARQGPAWQWPRASLGEVQESAGPAVLEPPLDPVPWERYLLWSVLVLGSLIVIGLGWKLLRSG